MSAFQEQTPPQWQQGQVPCGDTFHEQYIAPQSLDIGANPDASEPGATDWDWSFPWLADQVAADKDEFGEVFAAGGEAQAAVDKDEFERLVADVQQLRTRSERYVCRSDRGDLELIFIQPSHLD